jgi:hypothetical protein
MRLLLWGIVYQRYEHFKRTALLNLCASSASVSTVGCEWSGRVRSLESGAHTCAVLIEEGSAQVRTPATLELHDVDDPHPAVCLFVAVTSINASWGVCVPEKGKAGFPGSQYELPQPR